MKAARPDYNGLKRTWTQAIANLALAAKLPKVTGRVTISAQWLETTRRRDPDNVVAGGIKLILDGLVLAGVLEGDGARTVAGFGPMTFVYEKKANGVIAYINSEAGAALAYLYIPHRLPHLNELLAAREYGARKSVYRRGRKGGVAGSFDALARARGLIP